MPKIVGIDLGTTNSLVAIVEDGTPRVLPGRDGSMLVPSVIYFDEGGTTFVGNPAKEKMVERPRNTVFSIKRFMGKGTEDVREDLPLLPLIQTVCERRCSRLVDDAQNVQAGDTPGVLSRLALCVIEVRWNRDDCVLDLFA